MKVTINSSKRIEVRTEDVDDHYRIGLLARALGQGRHHVSMIAGDRVLECDPNDLIKLATEGASR